jgi:para-nitrobenzyl esterase
MDECCRASLVDVFDRGEQAPVPVLAGFNEGEIRSLRFLLPPPPADPAAYDNQIRERYGDLTDAFLTLYPAETMADSVLATTPWCAAPGARRPRLALECRGDRPTPAAGGAGLWLIRATPQP